MENIDARETHESEIALCCHQQILLIFYRIKKIRNEIFVKMYSQNLNLIKKPLLMYP